MPLVGFWRRVFAQVILRKLSPSTLPDKMADEADQVRMSFKRMILLKC